MADEKRENRSPLDAMSSVAKAALAVGAGAALLYKGGGDKLLSDGVRHMNRFLQNVDKDVAGRALKDWDAEAIGNAYNRYFKGPNSLWKQVGQQTAGIIEARVDNPNSLFGVLKRQQELAHNKMDFFRNMYNETRIANPLKELFSRTYAQGDDALGQRISGFVDDTIKRFTNDNFAIDQAGEYLVNPEFLSKHFKDTNLSMDQQHEMMDRMISMINQRENNLAGFARDNQGVLDDVLAKMTDVESLGRYLGKRGDKSFFSQVIDDSAVTARELLAQRDKVSGAQVKISGSNDPIDLMSKIEDLISKDERYGDLFVDRAALRMRNGKISSFAEARKVQDAALDSAANTLPGKILKLRSFLYPGSAPAYNYWGAGEANPIMAALAEGSQDSVLKSSYVKILDRYYRVNPGSEVNKLEHIAEMDGTYLTSGRHGTSPRVLKMMTGDADRVKAPNSIAEALDMFTTPNPTKWSEYRQFVTKFGDDKWGRNLLGWFEGLTPDQVQNPSDEFVLEYFKKTRQLNEFMSETTRTPTLAIIRKLQNTNTVERARQLLELLTLDNEQMMHGIVEKRSTGFHNKDLISLVNRYMKNGKKEMDSLAIVSDKIIGLSETRPIKFPEMMRKEIAKEVFLSHMHVRGGGRNSLINMLGESGITGQDLKEVSYLANWAVFQEQSEQFSSLRAPQSLDAMRGIVKKTQALFTGAAGTSADSAFLQQFQSNIGTMVRERASVLQKGFTHEDDMVRGRTYSEWISMKRAVSPLELLNNINNATVRRSFLSQFNAGRGNMQDVTSLTMVPYFAALRLVDPLSTMGLGFSTASTKNAMDLAKNIMLKRVLPVAGAITAYSYLDYEARNFTGTSLTGAFSNSLAAMDIGARRIADKFGIGNFIADEHKLNPFMQYYFGKDYQDSEERRDWYARGYSPVRKGRYWDFGSTSEFRGGKIGYWEPNYLRQAHSNWRDVGIYGSSSEKWAHSLIPTPRHPFAPIRYLLNPYWLEKKHYWDRPYPMTGKMFEEGTPWGAVLNPTIGQLIKPQRRMHRAELGGTLVDVRDLIAQQNGAIKQQAGLVRLTNTGMMSPLSYTAMGAPTPSERVLNIQIKDGKVTSAGVLGQGYPETTASVGDVDDIYSALRARSEGRAFNAGYISGIASNGFKEAGLSFRDKLSMNADRGGFVGSIARTIAPRSTAQDAIAYENNAIMAKAADRAYGITRPSSGLYDQARRASDLLHNKDAIADLRNTTSTGDFIRDAGYSATELLGIYGFGLEQIMPRQKSKRWQSADRISSFSRAFWDSSVGGLGGEFMEIARRFFPHEDHSREGINPIRNTMPDWMPSRFRYGDPYQQVPKGEMRLPGAGYETLNTLHPDAYGKYGAFDRMKILADVAPWSEEYKVWRSIASRTTDDPLVKQEMKEIRKRVQQQSKQHEFYPYMFTKNNDLIQQKATIAEIISDSGFRIVGDDRTYRMAGVKSENLEQYLRPGMNVVVKYGKDEFRRTGSDGSISAVVIAQGENINRKLIKTKAGTEREDNTAAGAAATLSYAQMDRAKVWETLAHLPIPYLHDKYWRISSPLESWKNEQIYGTSYATWSHPIQGFLLPAFQKAWSRGPAGQILGLGTMALATYVNSSGSFSPGVKRLADIAWGATNPGAFAGGMVGYIAKMGGGPLIRSGAYIGSAIGLAGYAATRLNNPIMSAANFAVIGASLAKQLNLPKIGINIGTGRGALIGAGVGLAMSAIKNPNFSKERMFGAYIPGRVEKRWEIQEYYDRLKYIKYMGLYEKAARLAKSKENVDIKKIINKVEFDKKRREKIEAELLAYKERVRNTYSDRDKRGELLLQKINSKLNKLKYPTQILRAGKYTRSALAYREAALSTIYGLKDDASFVEIMRAVSNQERDYLLEFAKVRDPKERAEILKYLSPYKRRALQIAWGQKPSKIKSNAEFFAQHKLPGVFWSGWQPDVNLDHVQIKTIKNEGMLLSDFGFYESEAQTPAAEAAPYIDVFQETGALELRKNLLTSLNGAGLIGVDVSIEPSSQPGIQMVANLARTTDYRIKQKINGLFGRTFY